MGRKINIAKKCIKIARFHSARENNCEASHISLAGNGWQQEHFKRWSRELRDVNRENHFPLHPYLGRASNDWGWNERAAADDATCTSHRPIPDLLDLKLEGREGRGGTGSVKINRSHGFAKECRVETLK